MLRYILSPFNLPRRHPTLICHPAPSPALSIPALDAYSFRRQKPPSPSAPKTTDIPTANARPLPPPSGNNPSVSPRIYSHPHYLFTASPSPHAITCNIPCSRPGKFAGLDGGADTHPRHPNPVRHRKQARAERKAELMRPIRKNFTDIYS